MYRHEGKLEVPEDVAGLNADYLASRASLADAIQAGELAGLPGARAITEVTDAWISAMWEAAAGPEIIAASELLSLGGYGREELAFASDIDLVIHVDEALFDQVELRDAVERFMAWCREPRAKLSHAVRTDSRLDEEFSADVRTAIAYLDARALSPGGAARAQELRQRAINFLAGEDEGMTFVSGLLEGYRFRHERFGQTIYRLEPELKNGPGGLRDLHAIRWAALVRWGFDPGVDVHEELGWTGAHRHDYDVGRDWILTLRHLMHLSHSRKHDRLNFPDQEALAAMLIQGPPAKEATEMLMARHYRIARSVTRHTERMLRLWRQAPQPFEAVGSRFRCGDGELGLIDDETPLQPHEVLEALELASAKDLLLEPTMETMLEENIAQWSGQERSDVALMTRFRRLLTDGAIDEKTSMRLLDLGLLAAAVPEFEPVVCHVQHDVYHVFTTDVHLVRCLEAGRSLLNDAPGSIAERWRMFGRLAEEIEDEEVFLLACLFHDIGKNRGGGHAEKGAAMMADVGPRLGLSEAQTDLLAFLVREHLSLSRIARRRDTSDPRVVRDLASMVRTRQTLELLTCLTACDMAVVGDDVLNDWNASLLLRLHGHVAEVLEHGAESRWNRLEDAVEGRKRALLTLVGNSVSSTGLASKADGFIRDLPAGHVVETPSDRLARQFLVYERARIQDEAVIEITPDLERGSTELIVAIPDAPGALSKITGTISSFGLNILAAQIVTTGSGRTLDIFQVARSGGASNVMAAGGQKPLTDPLRIENLRVKLQDVLNGDVSVEDLLRRRIAEQRLASKPTPAVSTGVKIIEETSSPLTVVEVKAPDRIGLLYEIASTLQRTGVNVNFSKVDSLGTQVIDTFYVEELDGGKLTPAREEELVAALLKTLEAPPLTNEG